MKKTGDHKSGTTKQASLDIKPPTYQPTKEEMNQEFDMPGASTETVRQAFFKPVKEKEEKSGKSV